MRDQYRRAGIRLVDLGEFVTPPVDVDSGSVAQRVLLARDKVRKLVSFIRQEHVDVLDVHLAPANAICAFAAMQTRIPFAVTLYQVDQTRPKLWLSAQFNLGYAGQLITDSEAQATRIREWLLRKRSICVIPNGTAPPLPALDRSQMLKQFEIPEQQNLTIIGQVSSLFPYKGHLFVIEAAKQVLNQHPNCFFLLVGYERGERGYKDSLLRRAAELGIAERVRIKSYAGPIGDAWSIIDIHIHASLLDSLPNAVLEAMSLGKPSIVTAVGGIPEVIKHRSNGLLVAPGDSKQLAECLLLLLGDLKLRETIGQAAQASYSQNFGPGQMTRRLEKVFSNLVNWE